MELTLTTPALLFPAISLLLLAYTNRFLVLAQLVRELHQRYKTDPNDVIAGQMENLQTRINLIRHMQVLGAASFFLCVLCMFVIFAGWLLIADAVFGLSLILLMASLALSLRELKISVKALNLQLGDVQREQAQQKEEKQ